MSAPPLRRIQRALSVPRGRLFGPTESALRVRLAADPNDNEAFLTLSEIVRRRAAAHHESGRSPGAVADAEWALAEELAQKPRAWYPLIELARLSLHEDPEAAQRRLMIAAERESTGRALAEGLAMLRREGMPEVALSLGVGHWRPREHLPVVGRELVQAAAEAGRFAEARRHLDALADLPNTDGDVIDLRDQLDSLARRAQATSQRPSHPS
ncbi:MAG: hypothetical protein ACRCTR_00890 [Actinomycetota bacterium]